MCGVVTVCTLIDSPVSPTRLIGSSQKVEGMFGRGQWQPFRVCNTVVLRQDLRNLKKPYNGWWLHPRAFTTVVSQERGIRKKDRNAASWGSSDASVFDEWLRANPLPDMAIETGEPGDDRIPAGRSFQQSGAAAKLGLAGLGKISSSKGVNSSDESLGRFDAEAEKSRFTRPEKFSWQETGDVLYECLCQSDEMRWDCELGGFLEVKPPPAQPSMEFIPPLLQPPPSSRCTPTEYLESLQQRRASGRNKQLLALLSSNAAAIGIFKDGSLVAHKVITAYTVRAAQGKSQLKYLRQGGPGRMTVGGAIRAKETTRFFNRVCEKFNDWAKEIEGCELLFFSGTTRVWNEVYAADPIMTIPRDDRRWRKVPFSIYKPRFREMLRVFYELSHGVLCHARR